MNEADTCRTFVVPKLQAAGWENEPHSIAEQRTVTDGRIVPAGKGFIRRPPKRVDYLLRYTRDFPLAVIEAKPDYKLAADGLQQAKDYATMLGLPFAYATNGREIVEFDTIVRLPNGVFAPYTSIPTNLLFFDRSGPTREVWYYEHPLPEGRKNYTKTAPIQFEEFAACQAWWNKREENERAWRVPVADLLAGNCNLDRKNPRAKEDIAHLPPEQIVASIIEKEQRIAEIMGRIQKLLAEGPEGGLPKPATRHSSRT
jgi:type I site-specific restriction endonuclease